MPLPKPEAPFLRASQLDKKTKATIVMAREATKAEQFSDVVLIVQIADEQFSIGMKSRGSAYNTLYRELGPDERKWTGKTVHLIPVEDPKYPKGYVDITV